MVERPLSTRTDILKALEDGMAEGLEIEFKASDALVRNEQKINDLCIDLSAMANATGGTVIYGIDEQKKTGGPVIVDNGVDDPKITREWIEQIIHARVHPRMLFSSQPVELSPGRFGFVINVPQSQVGPHQAPDKKYYRRVGVQSVAMEDYEIRDIFRRATTPDLFVSLSFLNGDRERLVFDEDRDLSHPFNLIAHIENRSAQPAYHAIVDIGIVTTCERISGGGYDQLATADNENGVPMHWFRWSLASPPALPIFREHKLLMARNVIMLALAHRNMHSQDIHDLTVRVSAPGFSSTKHWAIFARGPLLNLHAPGSPYAAENK
jgi:Putative DNA-binding domain